MAFQLQHLELDGAFSVPNDTFCSVNYSKAILSDLQAKINAHNEKNNKKVNLTQVKRAFLTGKTVKDGLCAVSSLLLTCGDKPGFELIAKIEQNGREFEVIARNSGVIEDDLTIPGVKMDFPVSELYLDDGQFSLLKDII